MKLANLKGRAVLVEGSTATDVATATDGRFGPSIQAIYEQWEDFVAEATSISTDSGTTFELHELSSPAPMPPQVFAIGLNYRSHAEETGVDIPPVPATFTKFPSSLSGPFDDIELSGDTVDWEVELVVVIGRRCDRVSVEDAWSYVAGLSIGQDISDRTLQMAAAAQFSLGKSYRGYGPIGPWLVTPDELADPNNLELGCSINGEIVQQSRTSDLIFDVPHLLAELSAVLPLLPGDVIFTGTPSGVGWVRQPPRFLGPDDTLESWIEGIGTIRNVCRAPAR